MPETGLLKFGVSRCEVVANVPRSFHCAARKQGVHPGECRMCWRRDKAPQGIDTHKDCIERYRTIALQPFNRKALDPAEQAIWELLGFQARGRERAMTTNDICSRLAAPDRGAFHLSEDIVRKAIREMRSKGYLLVSSNSGEGIGFFVPIRNEEILNFLRTQKSRKDHIHSSMLATARFLHCDPARLAELGLEPIEDLEMSS